jgi:TolB-like protein
MRRVAGGLLILAAVAAYWVSETWPRDESGRPIEYPVERIAFLYIEPRGDTTGLRYLADGLTEEVIHNLGAIDGLRVVPADAVRPFRGGDPPPDTIVQRLEVNTYLRSTLSNRRGVKYLQLELQNSSREIVQTLDFEIHEDNVFESIEEITRGIVDELRPVLGGTIKFERLRKSTSSTEAWDYYAQAANLEKVLDSFFLLRDIEAMEGIVARAEELIAIAGLRDPAWSEPHVLHGRLAETVGLLCRYTRDCDHVQWFNDAVRYATRAIELDSAAAAFELRGRIYHKFAVAGGSEIGPDVLYSRAEEDLRTAARDTLRAGPWSTLGAIYLDHGNFAAARDASERAYRTDSFLDDRLRIISNLFLAEFNLGNDEAADRWCDELRRYQPRHWPAALCALSLMNWAGRGSTDVDHAWEIVNSAAAVQADARPTLEMLVAPLLWRIGERDSANHVMRRAANAPGAHDDVRHYQAAALTSMGRGAEAIALLGEWIEESPAERSHVMRERWFRPILDGLHTALVDEPRSAQGSELRQ